ncbi:hypothetical protein [Pseudocitrobacter sp. 73]|uniref:hypothetical protein n=1 Tax=Pseudocitrobacter sp. 73 TaxID=2605731 RepID=UPI0011EE0045|nr:hypothetical protein [Pseudocitrobacter sp. 73]KAA1050865.1 hypothetical protein F0Q32_06815 [Pseudocitrobacter sp. 73]
MKNNALTLVLKNDWMTSPSDHTYKGKYTIGRFHLTTTFIIKYMRLMHKVEISDSWLSNSFDSMSDTDYRKVLYMECCDILSKDTINEIRDAVKSPPDNVKIYRDGMHITNIEIREERNEITL